jgi:hypothetical protein
MALRAMQPHSVLVGGSHVLTATAHAIDLQAVAAAYAACTLV